MMLNERSPNSKIRTLARILLSVVCVLAGSHRALSAQDESQSQQLAEYQQRLKTDPNDVDALEATARIEAGRKNFTEAIAAYRRVVAAVPDDRAARIELARLLGWNLQYEDSIRAYRSVLEDAPGDPETLEGLAAVEEWCGKREDAAAIYGQLASAHPENADYIYQAARLEAATHQYPAARDRLATVIALNPEQIDARLLLAQLELKQGQYASSLRQFEHVLLRRPADPAALMGAAQARYYTGDLVRACADASRLSAEQPQDFDALYLLASIERARGHRYRARLLLDRANRVSRHNAEVARLRESLRNESTTVLHLTAGYSREIGSPEPGVPPGLIDEDLRSFAFGSELDFVALPRSTSSFAASALPSESPSGLIQGAVAPTEFLYRQTTHVVAGLTLRGGIGMEHLGPGLPVALPNSSGLQPGATLTPIGFLGATYALNPAWSFDLTWSHLALPYTPLAARLGVVSARKEGGINWNLDRRTAFHLTYFEENLASESYQQVNSLPVFVAGQPQAAAARDEESGSGGTITFNRRVIDGERFALDLGASAFVCGYDGPRRDVDLGFFTPTFYQRDLLNGRLSGWISRRWGYDLAAGYGVQQVDQGQALKRAFVVSPTIRFRATRYLAGSLGYTHYDSTQILGIERGNGVRLGIDWKF
jgi:tetratricopeptide (TPR) repeat protein